MERQAILRRYRLALALIPDEDAAGDIFMRAGSEAELTRLAARWRQRRGLEPVEPHEELPALDGFQEAHALHLERRGRSRRRSLLALAVVGLALLLVVLGWGWGRWTNPTPALAPAFQRPPVQALSMGDGLRLSVYQVWAEPGEVTVWWDLAGPGAPGLDLSPVLELPGMYGKVPAQATERTPVNSRRVVARSTHRLQVTTAWLWFGDLDQPVACPLEGNPGSALTVYPDLPRDGGRYPVRVESVTLGREQTMVRYQAETPPAGVRGLPGEIRAGNLSLRPLKRQLPEGEAGRVAYFDPIPGGATLLTIDFGLALERVGPVVYQLPAEGALSPLTWLGDRVQAVYRPELNLVPVFTPGSMPYFTDREGRRYEVLENPPQEWDGVVQYSLVVLDPPEGVEFVSLIVPEARRLYPMAPVTIDLTRR